MKILWNHSELLIALKDDLIKPINNKDLKISEVAIDGRKPIKDSLFIALKGENTDGHNYLQQAVDSGAVALLVNRIPKEAENLKATFIIVEDTYKALYNLATFSRNRSLAKVIAVTGSVGKTGTKEMLKTAFNSQGKTFANNGNFNNHIGLPLSLCNLEKDCEFAIFEMGMNHLQEIEPLSKLAKPHVAIITNVGPVHIEFFKNEEEIALAKSEIFAGLDKNGYALINNDNAHFSFLYNRAKAIGIEDKNIISFGKVKKSKYQIVDYKIKEFDLTEINIELNSSKNISYNISSTNVTTIFNSIIIASCLDLIGKNLILGLNSLKNYTNTSGRGKINKAKINNKNITLIDDTYNASVLSMRSGIENASNLKKILNKKRVVCALGDMLELGTKSNELHGKVMDYIKEYKIDFAILVGKRMEEVSKKLEKNSYVTFPDSSTASQEIESFLNDDDILYLKGSRGTRMEKIIEKLTNNISAH
jgi:UDP-N-acetylmuramoyl-tripeptide--D-alanyl-D-alanine ligase